MLQYIKTLAAAAAMLLIAGGMARADEPPFDPASPPDPAVMYKLTVKANPAEYGNASGTGRYKEGTRVYVNTSSRDSDWRLRAWMLDGEVYTTSTGFYFTMPDHDVTLTAEYELIPFDPTSPADPSAQYKQRVYVQSVPEDACSFNITNGQKFQQGTNLRLQAYPSQSFVFQGWYDVDDNCLSQDLVFDYPVPAAPSALQARFVYDPESPLDPNGSQTDVAVRPFGDANGDGLVSTSDLMQIRDCLLNTLYNKYADLDGNGDVTTSDLMSFRELLLEVE